MSTKNHSEPVASAVESLRRELETLRLACNNALAALAADRLHRVAPGEFQAALNVIAGAAVLAERVRAEEDK